MAKKSNGRRTNPVTHRPSLSADNVDTTARHVGPCAHVGSVGYYQNSTCSISCGFVVDLLRTCCTAFDQLWILLYSLLYNKSTTKGQIPLRYPAREPARELVCDMLASC